LQESLTNVHRYSGSVKADIRIFQTSGCVHLEVTDHGKGLGTGLARSVLTSAPSLGVGIPGMRERVRQLGGKLEVEFGVDGTRVHALLPVVASQEPPGQTSLSALAANPNVESGDPVLRRRRILIADDHPVIRHGVRDLIESQDDWSICGEAFEGDQAVRKAKELSPDLLILDISMPSMSGIDAALQVLKDNPMRKILFLTEHDSPEAIRRISTMGVQGLVSKERSGSDLVNAVRIILGGGKFFPAMAASLRK
jgi:CheY-like chemotaxis protein